jgi:hypothetical protein
MYLSSGDIFLKTKNLWNLTFQTGLPLLYRQKLPNATLNFEVSAILMSLRKDHHLLPKFQHILLPQRTFETFLKRTQKG